MYYCGGLTVMALRTSASASRVDGASFSGTKSFGSTAGPASATSTPTRLYSSVPGVSAVYSAGVRPSSPRVPTSAADEIRSLRAHNEALQRQLTLKDQGLERLRQKVQERALMLSHEKAADIQQTRREAGTVIEDLEAENARLRSDLAHRTSQLHSAVTRIAALKSRMDDLILRNDELMAVRDRRQRSAVAARKRKAVIAQKSATASAQQEAMATVLGTQDTLLNMIDQLSFLPPREADRSLSPVSVPPSTASAREPLHRPPPPPPAAPTQHPEMYSQGALPPGSRAKRSSGGACIVTPAAVAAATVPTATTPRRCTASTGSSPPLSAATQVPEGSGGVSGVDVSAVPTGGGEESTGMEMRESTAVEGAAVEGAAASGGRGSIGSAGSTVAARARHAAWDEYAVSSAPVAMQPSSSIVDAARAGWRAGGAPAFSSAVHNARYEAAHRRLARFEQKFGQPLAGAASGSSTDREWWQPHPTSQDR